MNIPADNASKIANWIKRPHDIIFHCQVGFELSESMILSGSSVKDGDADGNRKTAISLGDKSSLEVLVLIGISCISEAYCSKPLAISHMCHSYVCVLVNLSCVITH